MFWKIFRKLYLENYRKERLRNKLQMVILPTETKLVWLQPVSYTHLDVYKRQGKEISTYKVDVSNLDEIKIAAQKVRTEVGKIDILINNAGIVVGKYFHENTHQDIKKTMLINSNALMHITLEFLPEMMKENSGAICNIASSAGLISCLLYTSRCV